MLESSFPSSNNLSEPKHSLFPLNCAVQVLLSNQQDKSLTNMLRKSCLRFPYHFSWQHNKKSKHSLRIQSSTSECNTPTVMIWMSRNNFVTLCKSYVHSRPERRTIIKLQNILTSIWKLFSLILIACKVKIKKQRLYWWHLEIFIKKLNGTEKECTCKSNKSCRASLSHIWNLQVFYFKPELANSTLNMVFMSSKRNLTWNKLHKIFYLYFGAIALLSELKLLWR